MELERLGNTKAVLKVGDIQLLFSNGKPVALYNGTQIIQDSQLYKCPPNSTRHALEWANALDIKETDIQKAPAHTVVSKFLLEAAFCYSKPNDPPK